MRFAGDSVRMRRFREAPAREPRFGYRERGFEYRDGLSITGESVFPSISPGMPDMGLPNPTGSIYKEAKPNVRLPVPRTRLGRLG